MSSFPNLPGYTFSTLLGQGSYGKVYKAFRKDGIRECVAVKCVPKKILNKNQKASDNLITEISLLKELQHENIVQMLDFRWDSEYIYLILEFCSGGDLQHLIQQRRCLPEPFVRKCLQQLSLALEYLHRKGIVHMDLKPQNILLSSAVNPILKIADFGFAQCLDHTVTKAELRGSPLYMAPEVFRECQYSSQCDLWSVGVILYECLFGQAPFASRTYAELVQKHMSESEIEIPSDIPVSSDCRSLLIGLLQRDPKKRMRHKEFFQHPFVDLEHAPCRESLPKARLLLSQVEDEKDLWKTYELYTEALSYLVAALHYEKNPMAKVELRNEINLYMNRAEELSEKFLLGGKSREIATESSRMVELKRSCSTDANMTLCANFIHKFYNLVDAKNTKEALDYFTKSFAVFHQTVKNDPDAERRELFYKELKRAMETAENLKAILKRQKQLEANRAANEMKKSCGVM